MTKLKLTPKQQLFVDEYIIDFNATQAAIRAGYSEKTANRIASRLLSKVDIQSAIQEAIDKRKERVEITQDDVVKEWAKLAFYDPRGFFDENKKMKHVSDLDDQTASAVAGMDVTRRFIGTSEEPEWEETTKIKLVDKRAALDSVAKHLGMFIDRIKDESGPKKIILQRTDDG